MRDQREHEHGSEGATATTSAAVPGKRTLTSSLAVQRRAGVAASATPRAMDERGADGAGVGARAGGPPLDDPFGFGAVPAVQARDGDVAAGPDITAVAERGVAAAAAPLPHQTSIQAAFGHHDVAGIRAQVGGVGAEASRAIGASAYATGDRVAFADVPDLHTAAHEAAHVVQQRGGVQLKGGVGQDGDVYERHADQVADLVVAGRSAEAALDGGPAGAGGEPAVQRKMIFNTGTDYLNIDGAGAGIQVAGYRQTLGEARDMDKTIEVFAQKPKKGTAAYTPIPSEPAGEINIAPLAPLDIQNQTETYNSRLIEMAHETRHGIDDLTKKVRYRNDDEERIHTEWRAFATQSAVAFALDQAGAPVADRYLMDVAAFASKQAFTSKKSPMVGTTASYLVLYGLTKSYDEQAAIDFMKKHDDWIDEALELFRSLLPTQVPSQLKTKVKPSTLTEEEWDTQLGGGAIVGGVLIVAVVIGVLARIFGYI